MAKLQKLQTLLQRYQAVKQYQEALEEHRRETEKGKELKHFIKEWHYNEQNKDPPTDLGNGKALITLWKALPDD